MCQNRLSNLQNIFEADHVASVQGGSGFGAENQILHRAWPGSPSDQWLEPIWSFVGVGTRPAGQVDSECVDMVWDRNAPDQFLKTDNVFSVKDVFQLRQRGTGCAARDLNFFVAAGIVDLNQEHKPVQLRFGQRIGSLLLDRVLRRQNKERLV